MTKNKDNFDHNRTQENIYPDGTRVVLQRPPNSQKKTGRWNIFGTIISKRPHGNSYIVNVDDREFILSQLHMRQRKRKNTEGFCIIQVDDNGFCKPVTHNHKGSMYLFTSMQFIMGIYRGLGTRGLEVNK